MPITLVEATKVYRDSGNTAPDNGHVIPGLIAGEAMVNPGPVTVSPTQDDGAGNIKCIKGLAAARAKYIGYNTVPNRAVGQALGVQRNVILNGFAGCTPSSLVWIDATSADATSTASGLTHTAVGATQGEQIANAIGLALKTDTIFIF